MGRRMSEGFFLGRIHGDSPVWISTIISLGSQSVSLVLHFMSWVLKEDQGLFRGSGASDITCFARPRHNGALQAYRHRNMCTSIPDGYGLWS